MSSSSLPALPTKGSPVASPVANTVLVRVFARSHLVHTETWRASSARRPSRSSLPSAVSKRLSKTPPGILACLRRLFYTASAVPLGSIIGSGWLFPVRYRHHRRGGLQRRQLVLLHVLASGLL